MAALAGRNPSWRAAMMGQEQRDRVDALMPQVLADLSTFSAIPSVAFPGFPREPVLQAANATVDLLRRYGVGTARLLDIPGGYPAVYGEIQGPPAPPTQGWQTDPFVPVMKEGRLLETRTFGCWLAAPGTD
jgi:acetylornithine deacetylase/succinyl-diaminopimelate desuccinylase-like protein